jgi:hypothetical protein
MTVKAESALRLHFAAGSADERVNPGPRMAMDNWTDPESAAPLSCTAPEAASDALRVLTRAIKSVQIYPSGNSLRARALDAAHQALSAFCDAQGVVCLRIQHERFLMGREAIRDDSGECAELARRFFRDGIREICILPGIQPQEVQSFVAAVVAAGSVSKDTDDLVTLLWGAELEHIRYRVIDDLEWDLVDPGAPPEADEGATCELPDFDFDDLSARSGEQGNDPDAASAPLERVALPGGDGPDLFLLSDEEREDLSLALAAERGTDLLRDGVWIIREILASSDETADDLASALVRAARARIAAADWDGAARILNTLAEEPEPHPPAIADAVSRLSSAFADPEALALMEAVLESGDPAHHGVARSLMARLPTSCVDPLCGILGRLENRPARHLLCEVLAARPAGEFPLIARWLSDERWYLVRNIVVILGAMKDRRAAPLLRPVLTHPDFRVRREAYRAYAQLGGSEALNYLARALDDPDSRARLAAAVALAARGESGAGPLLAVTRRRDFERRAVDERAGIFEALGMTGARALVPYLERLLHTRSIFHRAAQDATACHAALALGRLGGADAVAALEAGARTGPDAVRRACRVALARLRATEGRPWS